MIIKFCSESDNEMLWLSHTRYTPLDWTLFNPIKTYFHQEDTNLMQNDPNVAIAKVCTEIVFS